MELRTSRESLVRMTRGNVILGAVFQYLENDRPEGAMYGNIGSIIRPDGRRRMMSVNLSNGRLSGNYREDSLVGLVGTFQFKVHLHSDPLRYETKTRAELKALADDLGVHPVFVVPSLDSDEPKMVGYVGMTDTGETASIDFNNKEILLHKDMAQQVVVVGTYGLTMQHC